MAADCRRAVAGQEQRRSDRRERADYPGRFERPDRCRAAAAGMGCLSWLGVCRWSWAVFARRPPRIQFQR